MILASARTPDRRLPVDADLRLHAADHPLHRDPAAVLRRAAPAVLAHDRRRARLPARHLRTVPAHLPPPDPGVRRDRLQPDPGDLHAADRQHTRPKSAAIYDTTAGAAWARQRIARAPDGRPSGRGPRACPGRGPAPCSCSRSCFHHAISGRASARASSCVDLRQGKTRAAARRAAGQHAQPRHRVRLPPGQPHRRDDRHRPRPARASSSTSLATRASG